MHGLVHKGLECFITHSFGQALWLSLCASAGQYREVDTLAIIDDKVTTALLFGAAKELDRPKKEILEDFGIFLMTSEHTPGLRRLMRFGGIDYPEFLSSLDDLLGRIKLTVPTLEAPSIEVHETSVDSYSIHVGPQMKGFAFVLMGVLIALADDYGVLAKINHVERNDEGDTLSVQIFDFGFDVGRGFSLVGAA